MVMLRKVVSPLLAAIWAKGLRLKFTVKSGNLILASGLPATAFVRSASPKRFARPAAVLERVLFALPEFQFCRSPKVDCCVFHRRRIA